MTKRGEIYYMDWSPGQGSEQTGIRPAIIVQNNTGNQVSSATIVAAISTRRGRAYPFQVVLSSRESGLPQDSIIKCEQILTTDQDRLQQFVGEVGAHKMQEVDIALHRSLGLSL